MEILQERRKVVSWGVWPGLTVWRGVWGFRPGCWLSFYSQAPWPALEGGAEEDPGKPRSNKSVSRPSGSSPHPVEPSVRPQASLIGYFVAATLVCWSSPMSDG